MMVSFRVSPPQATCTCSARGRARRIRSSVAFIQAWTGLTYNGAAKVLKSLVEKGLLEKTSNLVNGVTFCHYRSVDPPKKVGTPSQKSWDNNTIDNNPSNEGISIIPPTPKRFDFRKALLELGVSQEVADAWMQVRKATKAVNTEIAFNAIANEIAKAAAIGKTPDDCIRYAVEKSWRGFKADWMADYPTKGTPTRNTSSQPRGDKFERMMEVGRELFGNPQKPVYDEQ